MYEGVGEEYCGEVEERLEMGFGESGKGMFNVVNRGIYFSRKPN